MSEGTTSLLILGENVNSKSPVFQSRCPMNFTEETEQLYLKLNIFWYCFLALITTIGLIVSLISNMIIVYLFIRIPTLRKNPSNIIAANLSLSDLLYCFQWPSVIYCSVTQSTWILEYDFVCQSFGFITVSTALASILTVLVISIERAIVIVYSIHAKNYLTIKFAWFIIILIWLISIVSCVPPLFGRFNRYTLDPSRTSCTLDYLSAKSNHKLYILVLYVVYWIVPAFIILISYILIIVTFKNSSLSLKEMERSESFYEPQNTALHRGSKKRRRTLRDSIRLDKFIGSLSSRSFRQIKKEVKVCPLPAQAKQRCKRRASASLLETTSAKSMNNVNGKLEEPCSSGVISGLNLISRNRIKTLKRGTSNSLLLAIAAKTGKETAAKVNLGELKVGKKDLSVIAKLVEPGMIRVSSVRSCQIQFNDIRSNLNSILNRNSACLRADLRNSLTASISANSRRNRAIMQFRLAKTSFYLILLWLVSWTPIASLSMLNSVVECYTTSGTAVFLASTMTKLGPTFDVFIYGISHPIIKSRFKQIIKRLFMLLTFSTKEKSREETLTDNSLKLQDKTSTFRNEKS